MRMAESRCLAVGADLRAGEVLDIGGDVNRLDRCQRGHASRLAPGQKLPQAPRIGLAGVRVADLDVKKSRKRTAARSPVDVTRAGRGKPEEGKGASKFMP